MTTPLLNLAQFTLSSGGVPLFEPVDLRLDPGEVIALRGENGIGKSSLLRSLAGLAWPGLQVHGAAEVLGKGSGAPVAARVRQGLMLQRQVPTAYGNLCVLEQLLVAALLPCGLWRTLASPEVWRARLKTKTAARDTLQAFGLLDLASARVKTLSMGQLRRLSFAAVELRLRRGQLRLLLLDEPASGLDAEGRPLLENLLSRVAAAGGGILLTEHLGEDVSLPGKRIHELRGRVALP